MLYINTGNKYEYESIYGIYNIKYCSLIYLKKKNKEQTIQNKIKVAFLNKTHIQINIMYK